jgi:hypothetical protein
MHAQRVLNLFDSAVMSYVWRGNVRLVIRSHVDHFVSGLKRPPISWVAATHATSYDGAFGFDLYSGREGLTWIRGHHGNESPEVAALCAAFALRQGRQ